MYYDRDTNLKREDNCNPGHLVPRYLDPNNYQSLKMDSLCFICNGCWYSNINHSCQIILIYTGDLCQIEHWYWKYCLLVLTGNSKGEYGLKNCVWTLWILFSTVWYTRYISQSYHVDHNTLSWLSTHIGEPS